MLAVSLDNIQERPSSFLHQDNHSFLIQREKGIQTQTLGSSQERAVKLKESTGLVYAKFKMKDVETNIQIFVQELVTITSGVLCT